MAKIELNIVALGDFSSVNAQIKSLQEQVALLQKNMAGVGVSSNFAKELSSINASFKQTMLSTGQFTQSTVMMTSETDKFGQALVTGKLKLTEYYNIIKQKNSEAVTQMKALALEQTKLQNSIVMNDPSKQGILSVYTPTQIDKVANATKIATNEANLYALAVKKGSQELINWGKNTQWAGRQLTVGMSIPLMIFGQQAVQSFKDVNTELTRLQRLYGEGLTPPSQTELNQISSQVLNLGKQIAGTMGIAQTETVKAAANFAAMGRQGQNLLTTTAETMRLSKLGAVSTADATNTVVALQNVYKVSTYNLADAVNFLSDIQKQTTMTLGDMTQAIPRVGPIMQQLGGTYKDTAVMLVAMREAGIPAAQAANAVKSAVASMIAPTAAASKEWLQYGINLSSIKDTTQGNPVQMITALQKGLQNLSPLVREQLIDKLFGKFQFARVSALLENFGKIGSQTQNALKIAGATSGELATLANQEMKQATESPTAKYQRALESFKATLYPVGQELIKIATKLMDFGNAIGKVFSGLPGPIKSIMGALAIGVAISGPIIMLTGLFANFAGFVLKGFFNLKQLVTGGKTLGTLLTPELIAAQNASQLFSNGIAGDVEAVNLLAKAIQDLTLNIQTMVGTLSAGTGFGAVLTDVANSARVYEQMKLPGFAGGGIVPGSSSGKVDTYPAMLAPGELVVDAETTKKYWPLFSAAITGKIPGYHKGNMTHAHPHNINGPYGEGEDGQTVYIGPKTGKTASAPAPIQGLASFISTVSGDKKSIDSVADVADQRMKDAGIVPPTAGQRKSYNQFDLAHIEHTARTSGGQKVWDLNNLATSTSAENNILNMFDKSQQSPKAIEEAHKLLDLAKTKILSGGMSEADVEKEIKNLKAGGQPITENGRKVYKAFLEEITSEIETDIKKMKADSNAKPTSSFISSHKNGKTELTPYGRMAYYADEYTGQRGPGGSLTPLEELRASKYAKPSVGKAIPLAQWEKDFAGPANEREFDPTSSKAGNSAYAQALQQKLNILKQHGKEETKEYKSIYENLLIATQQNQTQMLNEELKGQAARMNELRKNKQTETEEYKMLGQQLAQGYAQGIISEAEITKAAGSKLVTGAIISVAKTQKSASPSVVAEQLGLNFGKGYDFGILSAVPQATAAGQELAMAAVTGTEEGTIEGATTGGRLSRIASKIPFMGKLMPGGKMGNMLKFGASSAVMMGGQALTSMLPKGSNASAFASDASAGASLGMFIGPEGAAVGAAIGAALGGVSALIRAEKQHKAEVESSFKASSSVISAYGGTMIAATQAVYNFNTASKASSEILSKTAKDVAEINKLQSNDPLKQVGDLIKGYDTASGIIGTVKTFAAAQVAAGMDPKQVSQMVTDLLTYAGKTQYLNAALKEINAGTKDMTTATSTWLTKLKNTSDASTITATKYSDMSKAQKAYADGLLTTTNIISDQNTPIETVLSKISALGSASNNSASAVNGLALALQNAGAAASTVSQVSQWASMGITNMASVSMMLRLSAAGSTNLDSKNAADLAKNVTGDIVKMVEDQSASSIKTAQTNYDAEVKKFNAATAAAKAASAAQVTKAKQLEIDALGKAGSEQYANDQKLLKVKEAQLNTLKLQTAELQKQQQYQMSQQDLDSQMKLAQISGDYLKAAGLQQQKNYNASQFGASQQQDALQGEVDALKQSIADAQLKVSNYQSASPTAAPVDNSGVLIAKSALDMAKQSGGVKSMLTDINKYFKDSGFGAFKAATDKNGVIQVYVTGGKIDNLPGSPGNPLGGAGDPIKLSGNLAADTKLGQTSQLDISQWNNKTGNARSVVHQYANDNKIAKNTYFEIDQFGVKYVFYENDKGDIEMISAVGAYTGKNSNGPQLGPNAQVTLPGHAVGGYISGKGSTTSDSIYTRLSNGEYVIKADAVSHYGVGFFDSINAKRFGVGLSKPSVSGSTPRFSSMSSQNVNAASQSTVYNINMNVNSNASDPKAVADHVMNQITVATAKKNVTNTVGRR